MARKAAIAVFCILIGICDLYVMLNIYDPNRNTLRALSSVSMDIVCMLILFVLIVSIVQSGYVAKQTTRLFTGLLLATLWAAFTDFLNWAFDGMLEFGHLTFWFTVGSLCMGAALGGLLSLYLNSYMKATHKLYEMDKSAKVCAVINLVSFVLTFVLALTGTAFVYENGHYETGTLYTLVTVLPVMSVLYLACFVIRFVKKVGIHDVLAVVGYIVFMVAGALIEAAYSIGTTYVAVTIADVYIFAMLQNETIAREKQSVLEWMTKSNTDELTGFFNRNAYETDINALDNKSLEDDFIFVSIDVNALKTVNDSFGHNAGDEILVGAAECLKKCFGAYGKLYRTGGDEFVALIYANEEQLNKIRNEIDEVTQNWSSENVKGLALSCGYVTRSEAKKMSARQMAVLADRRMYEAKDDYYSRTGINRRKH